MEDLLKLITNSFNEEVIPDNRIMNQELFPYYIFDIYFPQCNTGYFYMLVSLKDLNYSYIGKTSSIRKISHHDSGVGCTSAEPMHLRPFDVFRKFSVSILTIVCYFIFKRCVKKEGIY